MRSGRRLAWDVGSLDLLEALRVEDGLALAAVVLLPWAFGGVELWAYSTAALLLVAALGCAYVRGGARGAGLDRGSLWLAPALLLGVWGLVQIVPLPPSVIRAVSPAADSIYRETFPGYPGAAPANVVLAIEERALERVPEAAGVPGPERVEGFFGTAPGGRWSGWRTLSLVPRAGLDRVLWYFALLAAFLVIRRRQADPEVAHLWRIALFGSFVALAAFALVHAATSSDELFWIREPRESRRVFGPFVNPTNFAAMMELAVPWLAAYAWVVARRTGATWRSSLSVPIFGAGAVLCLIAGFVAASKTAALLLAASLSVLALAAVQGWRRRLSVLLGALVLWSVAGALLALTPLGERARNFLESTAGVEDVDRWVATQAAWSIVEDFPLVGTGFGSFREVFDRYQPRGEFLVWRQMHDDYLQLLIEGGAVAGLLLLWLIAAYWRRTLRGLRGGPNRPLDFERLGILLGLGAMSLHAIVDFNHQIPGPALTFVALAAIACARAERFGGRVPAAAIEAEAAPRRPLVRARLVPAVAAVAPFVAWAAIGIPGGVALARGSMLADGGRYAEALEQLERAAGGQDPAGMLWLRAQVRHGFWDQAEDDGRTPETDALLAAAYRDYTEAIATSPASGWYWVSLAEIYQDLEVIERETRPIPLDLLGDVPSFSLVGRPGRVAVGLGRFGVAREPNVFALWDLLTNIYVESGLVEQALDAAREAARVQPRWALHDFRYHAQLPPGFIDAFAEASREVLGRTPLLQRGIHLTALGRVELLRDRYADAERDLRAALEEPGHELNRAEAWYYLGVALLEQQRWEEALAALAEARQHPNLLRLAVESEVEIAEQRGDMARALELLRELRRLQPRNVDHMLEFARVATVLGHVEQAADALRWGRIVAPWDLRTQAALVRAELERLDVHAASRALEELLRLDPEYPGAENLRRQIDEAGLRRAAGEFAPPSG